MYAMHAYHLCKSWPLGFRTYKTMSAAVDTEMCFSMPVLMSVP